MTLIRNGLQRMTARVLAVLLFTEQESVTAGEIGERLTASAGSVSTAIRSLGDVGLVERVWAPGSRREHYRCPDDAWARLMSTQNAAGEHSAAGRRLAIMHDFYTHLMRELPAVIDRWQQSRKET